MLVYGLDFVDDMLRIIASYITSIKYNHLKLKGKSRDGSANK